MSIKETRNRMLLAVGLLSLILGMSDLGLAYEVSPVAAGGSISGKVRLAGPVPPSRIFHLVFSPNIDYCQRISDGNGNRYLKEFKVSEDRGFEDVVVSVVGVSRGKPFDLGPVIEIDNCQISPYVIPVRNHQPIRLVNNDPVTHDLQAYSQKDPEEPYTFQMFNKPMPEGTDTAKLVEFRKGHYIFKTQCGVHDFMQSWGMAVGNPYYAVTGADGSFHISDLPPGEYDIVAWHPRMKIQVERVVVKPNETASLEFEFDGSEVETLEHDLQLGYRLETWLAIRELLPPAVELQVP